MEENNTIAASEEIIQDIKQPSPIVICLTKKASVEGDFIVVEGRCLMKYVRGKGSMDTDKLYVQVGEEEDNVVKVHFKRNPGIPLVKGWRLNYFKFQVPLKPFLQENGRRKLRLYYDNEYKGRFIYKPSLDREGHRELCNEIYLEDKVVFLRQSIINSLQVTSSSTCIPIVKNTSFEAVREGDEIVVRGDCLCGLEFSQGEIMDTDQVTLEYGEGIFTPIKFASRFGTPASKGWNKNQYEFRIPLENIQKLDIQNRLKLVYRDDVPGRIIYLDSDGIEGTSRTTEVFQYEDLALFFRQTIGNTMFLTVREPCFYDTEEAVALVDKAYAEAKKLGPGDFILMYEKECEKYEESASVLYEKLMDLGYENVYYILEANHKALENMPEKYRKNIIEKNSYDHIVKFFRCHKFVGTETIGHAIQLRTANKKIIDKINSKDLSYIFLQHGVMYMISLDADLRSGFRQADLNLYRVVVSSDLEAQHFIELGEFKPEELYITGLAKFDKSYRYDDADKIVIMPTWRRWEANEAREDFLSTKYYKMIERMVSAVPEELKEKIIILPHPLMQKAMEDADLPLGKYIHPEKTHDEVLRECRLLITDYSSISYDSFYRGSNAIFYWEEKDECLEHYGEEAKLMLNEDNAFGDVVYDEQGLANIVMRNYQEPQTPEHIEKYRKIVEFHDGKNSERIIEKMQKEGFIL